MDTDSTNEIPVLQNLQCWFNEKVFGSSSNTYSHLLLGRLDIYQNAYTARITDSLASDFKVLKRALGEEAFHSLIHHYIDAHSSTSFNISDIGKHLSDYLKHTEYEKSLSFLSELAELEWKLTESFWAENHEIPTSEELMNSHFKLSSSVHLLKFLYPVHKIIEKYSCVDTDFFKIPEKKETYVLVYRVNGWTHSRELEKQEYESLLLFKESTNLYKSIPLLETLNITPEALQNYFTEWVKSGLFVTTSNS